jgi:hypothetical protein
MGMLQKTMGIVQPSGCFWRKQVLNLLFLLQKNFFYFYFKNFLPACYILFLSGNYIVQSHNQFILVGPPFQRGVPFLIRLLSLNHLSKTKEADPNGSASIILKVLN